MVCFIVVRRLAFGARNLDIWQYAGNNGETVKRRVHRLVLCGYDDVCCAGRAHKLCDRM